MEVWTDVGFLSVKYLNQQNLKAVLLLFFRKRKGNGNILFPAPVTWLHDFGQVV